MRIAQVASWVHKWLALLVGVQVLFWVASGTFFALAPIERVRSEHLIAPATAHAIDARTLTRVAELGAKLERAPVRVTIEQRGARTVALAEFAAGPPALFDAATLEPLSPLNATDAMAIASAHVTITAPPLGAERVTAPSAEYRGALPAWRVRFAQAGLAVYVAEHTGAVTARRSDLWRVYDELWALHIMDWRNHEDFNHPLVIAVSALTLISVLAGIALLPYRLRAPKRSRN